MDNPFVPIVHGFEGFRRNAIKARCFPLLEFGYGTSDLGEGDWGVDFGETWFLGDEFEDGVVNFSPAVKRMLLSLRTEAGRFSEMLVSSPNGDAVLRHLPDPFSLVMASTNAADYNECRSLLDAGYSTLEALETMVWRRQPSQQGREARNA
jgi:hypothetical protein